MPEAARAALGGGQVCYRVELGVLHPLDDQLRDAVATADLEVGAGIGVDDDHRQFVPVSGVDQARGVDESDPVAPGQATTGVNEAGVAVRYRQLDTGGDQGSPTPCLDDRPGTGDQVGAGIAGPGVGGKREPGIENHDGYVQHHSKVAPGPPLAIFAGVLAWMDLEMTGLDPARHVIVEIASLITDDDLQVVAEGPDLVIGASAAELAAMDDVVRAMHTTSGLLAAVEASTVTLAEAGQATLDFLKSHIAEPSTVPLCGNSIGTDRRFLAAQMPAVEAYLHYRSIDVSTIKELVRRWYPEAFAGAPRKAGSHRALGDIIESVNELRYYRETVFRGKC